MTDLRSQIAKKAADEAQQHGKPAETSKTLEACFAVGEQQSGVIIDPGNEANVIAFPYAHFLNAEGNSTRIEILFSTHLATILGKRLLLVIEALRTQTLIRLAALPARYEALALEDGAMPIVQSITLEKQEDDDDGGGHPSNGSGRARPGQPRAPEPDDGGADLEDVDPPEHAITGPARKGGRKDA